ncbi:hypothetical protein [uncultured Sulfitobacter sp.]|uniref:hypothetical protein n=1 Tax=uncultured Sulfitobacter sp. TaxID=191468 RepID=UPI0026084C97|nr:hypothetical protein [uncultured Sulfitobacter sp.]
MTPFGRKSGISAFAQAKDNHTLNTGGDSIILRDVTLGDLCAEAFVFRKPNSVLDPSGGPICALNQRAETAHDLDIHPSQSTDTPIISSYAMTHHDAAMTYGDIKGGTTVG